MVNKQNLVKKIKMLGAATALSLVLATTGSSYFISDTITTRVTGTDIKRYDGEDKYLVNTMDGTFENTDVWYRLKFDSSDVQGEVKGLIGKEVEIEKYGWRIPMFSIYENIVDIKEVR